MNQVYTILIAIGIAAFASFEATTGYQNFGINPSYSLFENKDSTLAVIDRIMEGYQFKKKNDSSLIANLTQKVSQDGITRQEVKELREIFSQREQDAFERGLRHDTLIIDTTIYHVRHIDTTIYKITTIVDTIHRDTIIYEEKITGWRKKKKKKKKNGWTQAK